MCSRSYRVIFINVVLCGLFLYGYIAFRNYSYFSGLGMGCLGYEKLDFSSSRREPFRMRSKCYYSVSVLFEGIFYSTTVITKAISLEQVFEY